MYTKSIPHKNFRGLVRNQEVNFNLTEHEVLKLLVEFQAIFEWQERLEKRDPTAETDTAEVIEFYNNFEEILLSAWGELDASGDHFRKSGRYEFAESSVFHAAMKMFLSDQEEANKLLDGLMPTEGFKDIVKNADVNLAEIAKNSEENSPALNAEIARLQAQLAAAQSATSTES